MIKNISLDDSEWQQVLAIIAKAPWDVANPLLMKIGEQLRIRSNIGSLPTEDKEINLGSRGRGQSS